MNLRSLEYLNTCPEEEAAKYFKTCCGARAWINAMVNHRLFASIDALHDTANACFDRLADQDWLETFSCHTKIGDIDSLRRKPTGNLTWSKDEQAGMDSADEQTIASLAAGNNEYEQKFGYIFIVCASGKSAIEMLEILKKRLPNDPQTELALAAAEQRKITHLRLDKLEIEPR